MRSSSKWILVETLDREQPGVIAVHGSVKPRVPLVSFLSEKDRSEVLAVVAKGVRNRELITQAGRGGRTIVGDPIVDHTRQFAHGAWVRVTDRPNRDVARPSAWAFVWDLDKGVAHRGPIASDIESWADLGIDESRSIASGLAHLDLGGSITPLLAQLVVAEDGKRLQEEAIERRPDGTVKRIQFYARFSVGLNSALKGTNRTIRGLSIDLGPSGGHTAPSIGDLIAQAKSAPNENNAIIDPTTFEVLYWHGTPPTDLMWNAPSSPADRPFLHPDDRTRAADAVRALELPHSLGVDVDLRFRTLRFDYVLRSVTLVPIDLGGEPRAVLAVVKGPQTTTRTH